ncbi:hypothetical protein [Thorsellia anophelis]|nr:hypothetical protein [Thorsellia anophelis]
MGISVAIAEPTPDSSIYNFKIKDYQSDTCDAIFQEQDRLRITNASYWIKMLGCASEYSSTANRGRANSYDLGVWPDAFSWIISISNANPSINERKKMISLLQTHDVNIPNNIRPLTDIIHQLQTKELSLLELAESQDADFIALTDKVTKLELDNALLAKQLAATNLKLEHLADVEMQLSLRRQLQNQIEPPTENLGEDELNGLQAQIDSATNEMLYLDTNNKSLKIDFITPMKLTQTESLPLGPYNPLKLSPSNDQLNWYLPLAKNSAYVQNQSDFFELVKFLQSKS